MRRADMNRLVLLGAALTLVGGTACGLSEMDQAGGEDQGELKNGRGHPQNQANQPPSCSEISSNRLAGTNAPKGLTLEYTIHCSDPEGSLASISWEAPGAIMSSPAVIVGGDSTQKIAFGMLGTFTITAKATDGAGLITSKSLTLTAMAAMPPALALETSQGGVDFNWNTNPPNFSLSRAVELRAYNMYGSAQAALVSVSMEFGDGQSAVGNPLSHSFAAAGLYNVQVRAVDANGFVATTSQPVNVLAAVPPVCSDITSRRGEVGQAVALVAECFGVDDALSSITMDPGDGSPEVTVMTGSIMSIQHVYSSAGTFTSKVKPRDSQGNTRVYEVPVIISAATNQAPTCSEITNPTIGGSEIPRSLGYEFSIHCTDPDGSVASISWDKGGGMSTSPLTTSGGDSSIRIAFALGGPYTFKATATDNLGATTVKTLTLTATNNFPTYVSIEPRQGGTDFNWNNPIPNFRQDQEVTFSTYASSTSSLASAEWDFGDGSVASGLQASHRFAQLGVFTVSVVAMDSHGYRTRASQKVNMVSNLPPICSSMRTYVGQVGQPLAFAAECFDLDDGLASIRFDFGDGSAPVSIDTACIARVDHTFSAAGTFMAHIVAVDVPGNTRTYDVPVTINP